MYRAPPNAGTIFGLFALLSPSVSVADTAVDPGLAADDALANITMAQPDALGAIRTAPAMMPLLPRYQVALGAGWSSDTPAYFAQRRGSSSNGPVALGLNFKEPTEHPVQTLKTFQAGIDPTKTLTTKALKLLRVVRLRSVLPTGNDPLVWVDNTLAAEPLLPTMSIFLS